MTVLLEGMIEEKRGSARPRRYLGKLWEKDNAVSYLELKLHQQEQRALKYEEIFVP